MSPKISAVVCTYHREGYLQQCIQSLYRQTLPPAEYEIIIVDNSHNGSARDIGSRLQQDSPTLRYIHEPTPGLSAARNRGLEQARGDYIAFIDDDAIAEPAWLKTALAVYAAQSGDIGLMGGRVRPIFEAARPDWLSDDLLPFLSITNLGDVPRVVKRGEGIVGANMIFLVETLRRIGGFSKRLGRYGSLLLSNEELHVASLLEDIGMQSLYQPTVVVRHYVAALRLTKPWFRKRLYWQGRSDAIWSLNNCGASKKQFLNEAAVAATLAAKHAANSLRPWSAENSASSAFASECHAISRVGYVLGIIPNIGISR